MVFVVFVNKITIYEMGRAQKKNIIKMGPGTLTIICGPGHLRKARTRWERNRRKFVLDLRNTLRAWHLHATPKNARPECVRVDRVLFGSRAVAQTLSFSLAIHPEYIICVRVTSGAE